MSSERWISTDDTLQERTAAGPRVHLAMAHRIPGAHPLSNPCVALFQLFPAVADEFVARDDAVLVGVHPVEALRSGGDIGLMGGVIFARELAGLFLVELVELRGAIGGDD